MITAGSDRIVVLAPITVVSTTVNIIGSQGETYSFLLSRQFHIRYKITIRVTIPQKVVARIFLSRKLYFKNICGSFDKICPPTICGNYEAGETV
jgi:hypothetical protein